MRGNTAGGYLPEFAKLREPAKYNETLYTREIRSENGKCHSPDY